MDIKRTILLNPGPATTTDSVKKAQVVPDICPREKDFCRLMQQVQKKIIQVVNGGDDCRAVLFGASGTGGLEAMISSVIPETGRVLIVNNGAYGRRMRQITERYIASSQIVEYRIRPEQYPDTAEITGILDRYPDITHIGVVQHETTTGMINPAVELAGIAHARGVEIMVDAVSSFAGMDIDIQRDGFDYLVSTSNKNLQGMAGITFVITKKKNIHKTANYPKRNFYFNLAEQDASFEHNGQMRFTPPVQTIYALDQALDEFFEETLSGRIARYRECWSVLRSGLDKLGFGRLLPEHCQGHLITSVIEPEDPAYNFDDMHDYLYGRGFTIYPGKIEDIGTFRIANIGAITPRDIHDFIDILGTYLQDRGIRPASGQDL